MGVKGIIFSGHAETKFEVLREHGFDVSKDVVEAAVRKPDKVEAGHKRRKIAQMNVSASHVIRVIYEEQESAIKVITFYPGRRDRYED